MIIKKLEADFLSKSKMYRQQYGDIVDRIIEGIGIIRNLPSGKKQKGMLDSIGRLLTEYWDFMNSAAGQAIADFINQYYYRDGLDIIYKGFQEKNLKHSKKHSHNSKSRG